MGYTESEVKMSIKQAEEVLMPLTGSLYPLWPEMLAPGGWGWGEPQLPLLWNAKTAQEAPLISYLV